MPVMFFAELLKDGQIDRAMAVARGAVRAQPDYWMPALFLRLKGGKIWYEPGFEDGAGDFEKWTAVVGAVRRGAFTPIVGPGIGEGIYGDLHDAVFELAQDSGFPLAAHQRFELQQVSQFLQFNQRHRHRAREVPEMSCARRSCACTARCQRTIRSSTFPS